nr:MAG TPA: hypothetical protein [Bacteriophage sp.]
MSRCLYSNPYGVGPAYEYPAYAGTLRRRAC